MEGIDCPEKGQDFGYRAKQATADLCFGKTVKIGQTGTVRYGSILANPGSVSLLEGLGISYYKLAMVHKTMGNDKAGREYFTTWKNIISFLAQNFPPGPEIH